MIATKNADPRAVSVWRRSIWIGAILLLLSPVGASAGAFPAASIRFEQNATDGDVEVVFEITAGADGLAILNVDSPDGRSVADFRANDDSTLGIRQFLFESPEPRDVESLKAAYPEGDYKFAGASATGDTYRSYSKLSHKLPATTSVLRPGENDVRLKGLEIAWSAVSGLEAYVVEIEQEETGVNLTARLPGSTTSFQVPDGFLEADTEYTLSIGTVAENGNASYIEMDFTTAKK